MKRENGCDLENFLAGVTVLEQIAKNAIRDAQNMRQTNAISGAFEMVKGPAVGTVTQASYK